MVLELRGPGRSPAERLIRRDLPFPIGKPSGPLSGGNSQQGVCQSSSGPRIYLLNNNSTIVRFLFSHYWGPTKQLENAEPLFETDAETPSFLVAVKSHS